MSEKETKRYDPRKPFDAKMEFAGYYFGSIGYPDGKSSRLAEKVICLAEEGKIEPGKALRPYELSELLGEIPLHEEGGFNLGKMTSWLNVQGAAGVHYGDGFWIHKTTPESGKEIWRAVTNSIAHCINSLTEDLPIKRGRRENLSHSKEAISKLQEPIKSGNPLEFVRKEAEYIRELRLTAGFILSSPERLVWQLRIFRSQYPYSQDEMKWLAESHKLILEAIERKDADEAHVILGGQEDWMLEQINSYQEKKPEEPKLPTFAELLEERATPEEVVKVFKARTARGGRISASEILVLLNVEAYSPRQLSEIVQSCTKALIKVGESKKSLYGTKLPRIQQYRIIRQKAQELFDKELNHRINQG